MEAIGRRHAGCVNGLNHLLVRGVGDHALVAVQNPVRLSDLSASDLLELSPAEGLQLAEDLWESVAADSDALPLTEAQIQEIEPRSAEHGQDPGSALHWENVRRRLYQRFG